MSAPTVYDVDILWFQMPPAFRDAYLDWLRAHGIDPNITKRTEHLLIDAPLVRATQVVREEGGILVGPDGELIHRDVDVLIRTPPPRPEDYA